MKKWRRTVSNHGISLLMGTMIFCAFLQGAERLDKGESLAPRLIRTEHPAEPWVVGYHLEEIPGIELDKSGKRDMSGEIQHGLDWVWEAGGGLLYIAAGEYRLEKPIEVPPLVGLRGDFVEPGKQPVDKSRNTLLAIYYGRGKSERDTACITLDGSAGIDGFVIWYPEQAGSKVKPYAPAIRHSEMKSEWAINSVSRNLYLVNAYHGIAIGSPQTGTCIQLVKNVYGTPLETGIEVWRDADIPRLLNLDFDPVYLATSGLPGMEKFEGVARTHLLESASAIRYHRTDGSALADLRVRGYHIGLELLEGTRMSNGHWIDNEGHYINFDFRDCVYGVWIDNIKDHGTQFFRCYFEATKSAVFINNPMHGAGVAMFLRCTLKGGQNAVAQRWNEEPNILFSMMFTECDFGNTIDWQAGTISIVGSRFEFTGTHARFGEQTVYASLVDNVYGGAMNIEDRTRNKVVISRERWAPLDVPDYTYRVNHGSGYQPDRATLVNVADFGARPNDGEDDSTAIQQAIDAIAAMGGGYVLIPAGSFRIDNSITVREKVELRGVVDFWQHSRAVSRFDTLGTTKGTLLNIYHGKGDEDGYTFLLEQDAGINGISVHYPQQAYDRELQRVEEVYPWLFRMKGDRSYLKHVMASNPWRMVDAFTYSPVNIYLGFLCGAPLDVSIHLGEIESPMVDNVHFNSWYWNHVFWPNQPSERAKNTGYKEHLDNWMKANSETFILQGTRDLDMYGSFQFCTWKAFTLKAGGRSGLGPSGLIINSGNDWAKFGLYAHANNGLQFVNVHFIDVNQFDPDQDISSIYFAPDMDDEISLFQVSTWGTSPRFVWLEGASSSRLNIYNLAYQLYNTDQLNRVYSGQLNVTNAVRRRMGYPLSFTLGSEGNALFRAAYFPLPYEVISKEKREDQWMDLYGSVKP